MTANAVRAAAILVILQCMPNATADEPQRFADSYSRDFGKEGFDRESLVPFGKGADSLLQESEEGLAITLPSDFEGEAAGIAPRFKVRGDFEITVTYELAAEAETGEGEGVGASLYITTEDGASAALGRMQIADAGDRYFTFARAIINGEKRVRSRKFPSETERGQLRLRREGHSLVFEVRDDWDDGEFRELGSAPFTAGDVGLVRMAAQREDKQMTGTANFGSLKIEADELLSLPSKLAKSERPYNPVYQPPASQFSSVGARFVIILIGTLSVVGMLFFVRRRG